MALLWNYTIYTKNPVFLSWWDSATGIQFCRYNFNQAWNSRSRFYWENDVAWVTDRCWLPANYSWTYSWVLPQVAWWLGSNVWAIWTWAFTGSWALWMNIESTIEWSGTIDNANLWLILSAVATLSGIWWLSADVAWALQASATLAGQWDMSWALWALAWAVATLSGSGTMNNDITALAFLSADIYVNQSEASIQQLVDWVWNALASRYDTSGTMWKALADAAAAAAAWWSPLSTEEHEQLMKTLTTNKFIALQNP